MHYCQILQSPSPFNSAVSITISALAITVDIVPVAVTILCRGIRTTMAYSTLSIHVGIFFPTHTVPGSKLQKTIAVASLTQTILPTKLSACVTFAQAKFAPILVPAQFDDSLCLSNMGCSCLICNNRSLHFINDGVFGWWWW